MGEGARASTNGNEMRDDGNEEASADSQVGPTEAWRFDQTENQSAEADGGEECSEKIESLGNRTAAFGNMHDGDEDDGRCERKVDEEYPAPGGMLNQPSAEHGAERRGDGGEAGPGSDGAAALRFGERRADNGEAAGG